MESALVRTISFVGRETGRIVLHAACVVCERELPWRRRTASCCAACWSSLPRIRTPKCRSCAMPWSGAAEGEELVCLECQLDPLPVEWCDAWGAYRDGLERVLHAFKFEKHDFYDAPFAELLHDVVRRHDDSFDAVVPVPMHRAKLRKRGYNQAELLARALARRMRIRCETQWLVKAVERDTQSTLPRAKRAANVRNAFTAAAGVESRSILIVDDVSTTGETLRACAAALRDRGAARVCAVALAKA